MLRLATFVFVSTFLSSTSAAALWEQCGGRHYGRSAPCEGNTQCVTINKWYSQCQPRAGSQNNPASQPKLETTMATVSPALPTSQPIGAENNGLSPTEQTTSTGLCSKFQAKGKKFWGTCADRYTLDDPDRVAVLEREFGQITPEWSLKWDAIEPSQNVFNFEHANKIIDWAVDHGKLIRGHTFLWHLSLPAWVSAINDKKTLTSVIENHISNVAGQYKGKIYVGCSKMPSEVLNEQGGLRDSVFSRVLGEEFITIAFKAAKAADPDAIRYINDYNLEVNPTKAKGMVELVKRINAAAGEQLIQAIGSQMHLEPGNAQLVLDGLRRLSAEDVPVKEVAITELDIVNASPEDYKTVVKACLQVEKCVSVTSWGISDETSWRAGSAPLLFDGNDKPKPAYNAIISGLL